jgi:hypothetical protein
MSDNIVRLRPRRPHTEYDRLMQQIQNAISGLVICCESTPAFLCADLLIHAIEDAPDPAQAFKEAQFALASNACLSLADPGNNFTDEEEEAVDE